MADDQQQSGGHKPLDRYDILMDWFLEDARGIIDRLNEQRELTGEGRQALVEAVGELTELVGTVRTESIEAQRDIQRALKTGEEALARASRAGVSGIDQRLRQSTPRIAATAAIAGAAGAALGGLAIMMTAPLLLG